VIKSADTDSKGSRNRLATRLFLDPMGELTAFLQTT